MPSRPELLSRNNYIFAPTIKPRNVMTLELEITERIPPLPQPQNKLEKGCNPFLLSKQYNIKYDITKCKIIFDQPYKETYI